MADAAAASTGVSSFSAEWSATGSPSQFLPTDKHIRKQRAWERQPRPAFAPRKQSRRIWKRYDSNQSIPDLSTVDQDNAAPATPAKVVKKIKVVSNKNSKTRSRTQKGLVAKWDRRKSTLPRKSHIQLQDQAVDGVSDKMPFVEDAAEASDGPIIDLDSYNDETAERPVLQISYAGSEPQSQLNDAQRLSEENVVEHEPEDEIAIGAAGLEINLPVNEEQAQSEADNVNVVSEVQTHLVALYGVADEAADMPSIIKDDSEGLSIDKPDASSSLQEQTTSTTVTNSKTVSTFELAGSAIPNMAEISVDASPAFSIHNDSGLFDLSPVKSMTLRFGSSPSKASKISPRKGTSPAKPLRQSPRKSTRSNGATDKAVEITTTQEAAIDVFSDEPFIQEVQISGLDPQYHDIREDEVSAPSSPEYEATGDFGMEDTQTMDMAFENYEPTVENNVTTTMINLNDDTDFINDFLSRSQASKAAKISKRSSLSHKRDSDAVRLALASPRKALEDLDANSPSPRKIVSNAGNGNTQALESTSDLNISQPDFAVFGAQADIETQSASRRSLRSAVNSRSKSANEPPNSIALRRGDGSEYMVIKKTEAQELARLTRSNTRRNKGGAVSVKYMLKKLEGIPIVATEEKETLAGHKNVRWNEVLVAYDSDTPVALDREDEQKVAPAAEPAPKAKSRRIKALGAVNGTPSRRGVVIEEPEIKEVVVAREERKLRAPRIPTPAKPNRTTGLVMARPEQENQNTFVEKAKQAKVDEKSSGDIRARRRSVLPRSKLAKV